MARRPLAISLRRTCRADLQVRLGQPDLKVRPTSPKGPAYSAGALRSRVRASPALAHERSLDFTPPPIELGRCTEPFDAQRRIRTIDDQLVAVTFRIRPDLAAYAAAVPPEEIEHTPGVSVPWCAGVTRPLTTAARGCTKNEARPYLPAGAAIANRLRALLTYITPRDSAGVAITSSPIAFVAIGWNCRPARITVMSPSSLVR